MAINLAQIVASIVPIVNTVISGAQVDVTHEPYVGQDKNGRPQYAAPLIRSCVEQHGTKTVSLKGQSTTIHATHLTFTGVPFKVDTRDRFTTSDGQTGTIVEAQWTTNPTTGLGYTNDIWIGHDPV